MSDRPTAEQLNIYRKVIRSMAFSVAGKQINREDLEDIVQGVILDLLDRKLAMHIPSKGMELTTYVGMIARNYTIDYMRKRSRRPTECYDPAQHDRSSEEAGVVTDAMTLLMRKEQVARLRKLVSRLAPDEQRFLDRAFSGDSMATIAAELEIPEGRVNVRKNRLVQKLKAMLSEDATSNKLAA